MDSLMIREIYHYCVLQLIGVSYLFVSFVQKTIDTNKRKRKKSGLHHIHSIELK